MKITDIEIIPIYPRLAERYDNPDGQARMANIDCRTVFKVTTDEGIVGYGDYYWADPVPASEIEPLIDRSPFDFMLADMNLGLGSALYDAMGKYLEVPVYKLLGQKVRDAGAVAAWTRPCSAEIFAGEVRRAVDEGYRVFKMHTSPEFDPLLQAEAAADVAPDGFRIHFDFNGYGRTLGVLKPLVAELERRHPIVGFIEDPLPRTDIDGWRRLRAQTAIDIVHGGFPALTGYHEMANGVADIYMLLGPLADMMSRGTAAAAANTQVIMQLTGGTLMKAMTLHLMAVLPTASAHSINLDDQYEEDITTERIPVIEGFLAGAGSARPRLRGPTRCCCGSWRRTHPGSRISRESSESCAFPTGARSTPPAGCPCSASRAQRRGTYAASTSSAGWTTAARSSRRRTGG